MPGKPTKRRAIDGKHQRPSKKQKRTQAYHSDSGSDNEDTQDFDAVNLLDSDDDVHNATVDDVESGNDSSSSSEDEKPTLKKSAKQTKSKPAKAAKEAAESEASEDEEEAEEEEEESDVDEYDLDSDTQRKPKSKRNDPSAFATSISKILSTKLSTSKRSDPVLSRSAAAHESSKAAVDLALEAKARRHLKEQKKQASERGRVKDVLIATRDEATGAGSSTAEILETERKLRKVAQRGVVKLFNAVRAAQVKAADAEKETRRQGVIGMGNREERVNEMSKKGFLELIASGGGGLKKGALEEA